MNQKMQVIAMYPILNFSDAKIGQLLIAAGRLKAAQEAQSGQKIGNTQEQLDNILFRLGNGEDSDYTNWLNSASGPNLYDDVQVTYENIVFLIEQ